MFKSAHEILRWSNHYYENYDQKRTTKGQPISNHEILNLLTSDVITQSTSIFQQTLFTIGSVSE